MIAKHTAAASTRCPTLRTKPVAPHVLRHTAAMTLLAAGVDQTVIALWLGHERVETTDIYIHGDLTIKERAIARTAPRGTRPGRYKAPDPLLAFLERL
jgi:site-specific recombinase XerD